MRKKKENGLQIRPSLQAWKLPQSYSAGPHYVSLWDSALCLQCCGYLLAEKKIYTHIQNLKKYCHLPFLDFVAVVCLSEGSL